MVLLSQKNLIHPVHNGKSVFPMVVTRIWSLFLPSMTHGFVVTPQGNLGPSPGLSGEREWYKIVNKITIGPTIWPRVYASR